MSHSSHPTVLLVADVTGHGGTTNYLCQKAMAARSAGWNCHALLDGGRATDPVAKALADMGVELTRSRLYPKYHPEAEIAVSMQSALLSLRPDVVHVTCGSIRSCIVPREVTIEHGTHLLSTEQYVSRLTEVSNAHLSRLRQIHAKAFAVITVSHENRVLLCQRLGMRPNRLFVIPNAVPLPAQFRPPSVTAPRKIVTVTRLTYQKGVDTLLLAMAQLRETLRSKTELTVIGDGELRDELIRLAQDLGLASGCVKFEGWRDDVNELLSQHDLFVLPSRAEGQPFALIEALVQGLPCISTWVSGNPEVLGDGRYGDLVPPDAPAALTRAITRFLEHPQRLREMSSRVGPHLRTHHDSDANMNRVLTLWEEARASLPKRQSVHLQSKAIATENATMKRSARLLVAIVSTNDGRWLSACFDTLKDSAFRAFDVVLIDNCCGDETPTVAGNYSSWLRCCRLTTRLSFAETNNLALDLAISGDYRYVMLLNPDTQVHREALGALVDFLDSNHEFGIAGSWQGMYGDDTWNQPNEWTRQMLTDASRRGNVPTSTDSFTVLESSYVQGAAFMVRTGLLTRIGLLDTVYGTFYEETDLCRRCRVNGHRVALLLDSRVQHEGGGHWKRNIRANRWRDCLYLRNQLLYELSEPHLGPLPLRRAMEIVSGQLHSVRYRQEELVLPLWQYPRVLAGLLSRIGYLRDLRRRNREIVETSGICDELRCIGPQTVVPPSWKTEIPHAARAMTSSNLS